MLYVKPAPRPLKGVSSSPTRATAPPVCQIGNDVSGDWICNGCSTLMPMTSSVSPGTPQCLSDGDEFPNRMVCAAAFEADDESESERVSETA